MEYLNLIEELKAEEASVKRLFGKEGTPVRSRSRSPEYLSEVAQAAQFVAEVVGGRRPAYHLQEAMTTSDFPLLFGDIVDRTLLGGYRETPTTYRNYSKVGQVRDFREVKRFQLEGADNRLEEVDEQEEYPEADIDEAKYQFGVSKFGRRMAFSWETIINDEFSALTDIPARYGRAARRTEEFFATGLFVASTGPHGSFYTSGNKNIINTTNGAASNNPALSIQGLQDGFSVLARQLDAGGEPIVTDMVHLVVPPALEFVANNILNAMQIELTEVGGLTNQKLIAANWMKNRLRLSVNSYLPVISTTNGNTSWYMFADPGQGRPALEVAFLRGHEDPETFMKEPNARRVGGGTIDPMDGDFDTDSIEYKVRHVLGGSRGDPKATVASNGTGS